MGRQWLIDFFFLFFCMTGLSGCYPEEFDKTTWGPEPLLELAMPGVTFQAEASSQNVAVTTNYEAWSISLTNEGMQWCSAAKEGNSLVVSVQANLSETERETTVTLTVGNGTKQQTAELAVTQLGADSHLELESSTVVFEPEGGSNEVFVSANIGEWTTSVTVGADWCGASRNGDLLVVTALPYTGKQQRQAVVTLRNTSGEVLATFTVVQMGSEPMLEVGTLSSFETAGGTQTIPVITNQATWSVTVPGNAPWCVAQQDGSMLVITVEENLSSATRSCELLLLSGDGLLKKQVRVVQFSGSPELMLSQDTLILYGDGGAASISVFSNRDWSYTTQDADWFSVLQGEDLLTIQADKNPSASISRSGRVVVTAAGLSRILEVIQQPSISLQPGGEVGEWEKDTVSEGSELEELVLERDLLIEFYYEMNGDGWADQTGWKTRQPLSEWYGVTTDAAGHVIGLDLTANNLSGQLSGVLAGLEHLQVLRLSMNSIRGTVPAAIWQLPCYVRDDVAHQYDDAGYLIYLDEETIE